MKFKQHLLWGAILSYFSIKIFNLSIIEGTVIFLASVLIDFDHYLWYGAVTKDWNPFHAINWYNGMVPKWIKLSASEKKKFKKGIFIFHSIGFWIILYALSLKNPFFLWILIGIAIHLSGDYIYMTYHKESLSPKISAFYTWKKNKGKKELIKEFTLMN